MTNPTRPSHRLPRPIFDKLLELEEAVGLHTATWHKLDHRDPSAVTRYLHLVMRTGQLRDELAELILEAGAEQ